MYTLHPYCLTIFKYPTVWKKCIMTSSTTTTSVRNSSCTNKYFGNVASDVRWHLHSSSYKLVIKTVLSKLKLKWLAKFFIKLVSMKLHKNLLCSSWLVWCVQQGKQDHMNRHFSGSRAHWNGKQEAEYLVSDADELQITNWSHYTQ